MNWRLVGLLVAVVGMFVSAEIWVTRPKPPAVQAVVSVEKPPVDSRRYATQVSLALAHAREIDICRRQALCDAGLLCARAPGSGALGCYGSTCAGPFDPGCGDGQVCLAMGGGEGEPLVQRCAPKGLVPRGGRCVVVRSFAANRCASGLACLAGVCASQCGDAGSCGEGEQCRTLLGVQACLPPGVACETNAECPTDHTCGPSQFCVHPASATQDCLPGRCRAGQACAGEIDGALVYGACRPDCTASRACEGGEVCVPSGLSEPWVCEPRCEVQADCKGGSMCRSRPDEPRHCSAGPALDAADDEAAFRGPPEALPRQASGTDPMATPAAPLP